MRVSNTLTYYNDQSDVIFTKYIMADLNQIQSLLINVFCPGSRILELGSGSGRDLYFMHQNGFDVLGIEGSKKLFEKSISKFPELKVRTLHHVLPYEFPRDIGLFDGFIALAFLIHFNVHQIKRILADLKGLLNPQAIGIVSVSVNRQKDPADTRFFNYLFKTEWDKIFSDNGFEIEHEIFTKDIQGREIDWITYVLKLG